MAHAMSCCLRNNKLLRPALQLVLFFSFLGWQLAYGAQPLITDDTGTQGKGKTQLELTGQYDWDMNRGKDEEWRGQSDLILWTLRSPGPDLRAPLRLARNQRARGNGA